MFDKKLLKVLADTRIADLVIRLTADEGSKLLQSGLLSETYLHEWMHYFQFSITPTGILMSRYRRSCFTALRNCFGPEKSSPAKFAERLAYFKENWQAWPSDWHVIGDTRIREVEKVTLKPDGLRVNLKDLPGTFSLPIGVHALFEAGAWCAERLHTVTNYGTSVEIPKSPGLLQYTWPLWVLADVTNRDIDSMEPADLIGLGPILLIAAFYDKDVLSCHGPGLPSNFSSTVAKLEQRNVTIARLIWQMFTDYHKFWSVELSLQNTNSYLQRIGLPSLSHMLACTSELLLESARVCREFIDADQREYNSKGFVPLMDDLLVEYDILSVSHTNIEIAAGEFDDALASPYTIARTMAPPVCAVEAPNGFDWYTIGFGSQADAPWGKQNDTRAILREQLSITEHIMIQRMFGEHLGCYGSPDWKIPINYCPHALPCMKLTDRKGIEFCADPAWRQKVASVMQASAAAQGIELSDEIIPGIEQATRELDERFIAPGPLHRPLDLKQIGIDWLEGLPPTYEIDKRAHE